MTDFTYTSLTQDKNFPTLGLLVLQTDETIEHDFQRLFSPAVAKIFASRVPNAPDVTTDTLGDMARSIPASASLLPNNLKFSAIGYGCTSASSVIGETQIEKLVHSGCNCTHVTNPLSALIAACTHLEVTRLAFLSPYVQPVSDSLRNTLREAGIETPVFGSFNEGEDTKVANIDKQSIFDAAVTLGRQANTQALFLSCTNLKTLDVIADIEAEISKPVISSNLALAWHMAQLAGIKMHHKEFGSLLG